MIDNPEREAQRIAKKHYNKHKQELDLTEIVDGQEFPEEYCRLLFKHRDWTMLRVLALNGNQYSSKIVKTLAEFAWPNLVELHLGGNPIGCEGVRHLVGMKLATLKFLDLREAQIKDEGTGTLFSKIGSLQLHHMNLEDNPLTHKGLRVLGSIEPGKFLQLRYLNLSNSKVGSKGIRHVGKIALPALNHMVLNGCEMGVVGVRVVGKMHWPHLERLQLNGNRSGLHAFDLLQVAGLGRLKVLGLVSHERGKRKRVVAQAHSIVMMGLVSAEFAQPHLQKLEFSEPGIARIQPLVQTVVKSRLIICQLRGRLY